MRATVLSITNQADAVGQWTGGPALGAVGNVFGIRAALAAGAACMLPALALYGRAIRHGGEEPELEALPTRRNEGSSDDHRDGGIRRVGRAVLGVGGSHRGRSE